MDVGGDLMTLRKVYATKATRRADVVSYKGKRSITGDYGIPGTCGTSNVGDA